MQPERRRAERIVNASIAYIHLAPDNGGIVLNLSEDGLAFHSAAPVEQEIGVHFWMSLRANERIEGTGDLAWMDGSGKTGGLRLTGISAEAREQIRSWMQSDGAALRTSGSTTATDIAGSQDADEASLKAAAALASFLPESLSLTQPESAAPVPTASANAEPPSATEQARIAEPSPPNSHVSQNKVATPSVRKTRVRPNPREAQRSSRTLGLLVLAVVLAAAVGVHFRGQLGSFLIYIGNQLTHTKPKNEAPAPATTVQSSGPIFSALSAADQQELSNEIAEFDGENRAEEARKEQVRARHFETQPSQHPFASAAAGQFAKPPMSSGSADLKSASAFFFDSALTNAHANTSFQATDEIAGNNVADADEENFQGQPAAEGENTVPETGNHLLAEDTQEPLYLDVGNSKDMGWADETATTLAKMGFNATVDHKGHLWASSYHVLVGPFTTDDSLDRVSDQLKARGFTTHYAKR